MVHIRLFAKARGDVLTRVFSALVDGTNVIVVAILCVHATVVHGLVDAVPISAEGNLAGLWFAIIGAGAAVSLLVILAGALLFAGGNVADVDGADLAVVAHTI